MSEVPEDSVEVPFHGCMIWGKNPIYCIYVKDSCVSICIVRVDLSDVEFKFKFSSVLAIRWRYCLWSFCICDWLVSILISLPPPMQTVKDKPVVDPKASE